MLKIEKLSVKFPDTVALKESTFCINDGEIVGIVGESGSGKSITAKAIMGLLKSDAKVSGDIWLDDVKISGLNSKSLQEIRGKDITMVFQEPMTSLNPLIPIGKQVEEVVRIHEKLDKKSARTKVIEALESVELSYADKLYDKYPHELSGGMRQRVMIAMATIMKPKVLIADEPTTALDVSTQEQIIKLIKSINETKGTSVMFITHNLKLAKDICHRIIVMHNGEIVESASAQEIFENPKMEYTKKLISAVPARVKLKGVMKSESINS